MDRLSETVVKIALSVCVATAAMVIVLALFASHTLWLVLPVTGILAVMGIILGSVASRGSSANSRGE